MLFNSYIFQFGFLPIVLGGYYGFAHLIGARAAKIWLCIASLVFYGWWNPAFVLLLATSVAFNYLVSGHLVGEEAGGSAHQGKILFAGVAANLLLLFYYKYLFVLLGFFHESGWLQLDAGSVILPLGISFFTFTQIGYLVDCREGLVRERGLVNYVLFATFFPHLIAGPILHHREIMPQFASDAAYRFRVENLAVGLTLFACGLAKKAILADSIAPWADVGFAHVQHLSLLESWSVALGYSMQLYFDFSGYSDMAIGLGIMFSIKMPLNFNSPYKSMCIIDFWQRWHMTLTRYLTLLLYNPIALRVAHYRQRVGLALNRKAAATVFGFASMIALPTFATMFLAGVWHGAGLQFIAYGLLHGLYLTVNHAWRVFRRPFVIPTSLRAMTLYSVAWRVVLTYCAVLIAQIFFRASSASDAIELLSGMVGSHGTGLPLTVAAVGGHYLGPLQGWLLNQGVVSLGLAETYKVITASLLQNSKLVLLLGVLAFGFPNVYQLLNDWSPALTKVKPTRWRFVTWRPTPIFAVATGVLLAVAVLYCERATRFLYFQF